MNIRTIDKESELLLLVERGEELPSVLVDTCLRQGISTAVVVGSGRAHRVVLEGGPSGRRRVEGPLEILNISGVIEQRGKRLEPELRLVASRELDTGLEMVGGVLIEGSFESCVLEISPHHSKSLSKQDTSAAAWSAVAAASAETDTSDDDAEMDELPRLGDTVEHPKFGPCVVRGFDDEHVKVRLEGGRTISLRLSHLSFSLRGELSTGKRHFSLKIGKK